MSTSSAITLLLPYYFDAGMTSVFEGIGFRVLWSDCNPQKTEELIMDTEPDLAIEWQWREDDFPIRDLLRKHRRKTPIVLSLNWNNTLPDNFNELGYAAYIQVPMKMGHIMDIFDRII
jgi:hypothetical protein